ncbi:MAG: hypothetical protein DRQ40_03550 [Gammaproteobacteria bacterium]|nr:MAG: hypothetical protein DRQ40_03550 [Gammaproteobacteria bacterium]
MASTNFTNLAKHLAIGSINFDTDVFYAMLVTSIPTTTDTTGDMDTWEFRADVGNEVAETGNYTAGGFVCTPAAPGVLNLIDERFETTFSNGAPAFAASTITAVGAIIFRQVGGDMATPATDELISFVDFEGTVSSTNGDFNVTFLDTLNITV